MRNKLALAAACLALLSGCGAGGTPAGLLEGMSDAGREAAYVLDFDISGAAEDPGTYVEARGDMTVLRDGDKILVRDAALRLEQDGVPFDREMEVWTEGGDSYVYIGAPGEGGVWYAYPAADVLAVGIDPLTLGSLPSLLASMGASGNAEESVDGGTRALSFEADPDGVGAIVGRTADDLASEEVEWDAGTVRVSFDRSGEWSVASLSAEGRSDTYAFTLSLDLSRLDGDVSVGIPEGVREAAEGNYRVGPKEGDGA